VEIYYSGETLPTFLGIIHRHFEKSLPAVSDAKEVTLIAPLDLLDYIVPDIMLDKIESIEIRYVRRT
jgi:hypothetical protein